MISDYNNGNESQSSGAIDASEGRESSAGSCSLETNTIEGDSAQNVSENEEQDVLVPEATNKVMVPETLLRMTSDEAVDQSVMQSDCNNFFNFKHFDTAKDPLDHHFLGATEQVHTFLATLFVCKSICPGKSNAQA